MELVVVVELVVELVVVPCRPNHTIHNRFEEIHIVDTVPRAWIDLATERLWDDESVGIEF